MATRSVRASAEQAARKALRQDLQQRAQLVGRAAETQSRVDELLDDLRAALEAHDAAVAAAVSGGWSRAQLRELGIQDDPGGRAVRRALRPSPGPVAAAMVEPAGAAVAQAPDAG
ncbi:hypothetical protein QTQ03_29400 [Micromonospora sp. WMMA1363]|uniref:hypothetical protein n=1 Tax=Micromonospora sp. WMMA1363 TaxID=3053985 RepID=UPI00259D0BC6|nr:hypothetical protein [Micromonospora sp. WMMA1363]MDM4723496.1 hypothetical protein [Micromonospora sp. WMMA1363]